LFLSVDFEDLFKFFCKYFRKVISVPIPVVARSKAWVWDHSLAGIAGSNTAGARMSLGSLVFCKVELSVSG
jgi:hypothetical protein